MEKLKVSTLAPNVQHIITLKKRAMQTSGNYNNYTHTVNYNGIDYYIETSKDFAQYRDGENICFVKRIENGKANYIYSPIGDISTAPQNLPPQPNYTPDKQQPDWQQRNAERRSDIWRGQALNLTLEYFVKDKTDFQKIREMWFLVYTGFGPEMIYGFKKAKELREIDNKIAEKKEKRIDDMTHEDFEKAADEIFNPK
jgi:hypothetical protein